MFDSKTGKSLSKPASHDADIQFLEFLPNGKGLLAVGSGGTIHVWDPRTGVPLHEFPGHTGPVRAMVPTPDGGWITAGDDAAVILWDANGKEIRRFVGHKSVVGAVALSADGKTLFTAGTLQDATIRAWDVGKGAELRKYTDTELSRDCIALSPDGKTLVVGGGWFLEQKGLRLYDAATLTPSGYMKSSGTTPFSHSHSLMFSGARLVTREPAAIHTWDIAKHVELYYLKSGAIFSASNLETLPGVAVSSDGKKITSPVVGYTKAGKSGCIGLWDTETGKEIDVIEVAKEILLTAVAFTQDGKNVVAGGQDGKVYVVDLEKKAVRQKFEGHRGPVLCLAVSADGKTVASGSADTTVLVWDLTKP